LLFQCRGLYDSYLEIEAVSLLGQGYLAFSQGGWVCLACGGAVELAGVEAVAVDESWIPRSVILNYE
jgi:hypothetical protein